MFKALVLSTLAVAGLHHAAFAADYQATGTSGVSVTRDADGNEKRTIITTSFEVADLYSGDTRKGVLLNKILKITSATNMEGQTGKLAVEARVDQAKAYDKVAWTIAEDADGASLQEDDLYVTWLSGCCDAMSGYRAYNVAAGKLVLAYDETTGTQKSGTPSPFAVEVPNSSLLRFAGVTTSSATRDFKDAKLGSLTKAATLTWASKNGPIQKVSLYAQGDAYGFGSSLVLTAGKNKNEIRDDRLTLWTADGQTNAAKAFNGFAISLKDQDEKKIVIPVTADRFDVGAATLPAGYKLVAE